MFEADKRSFVFLLGLYWIFRSRSSQKAKILISTNAGVHFKPARLSVPDIRVLIKNEKISLKLTFHNVLLLM